MGLSANQLVAALWELIPNPPTATAYTGTVTAVVRTLNGVVSVSVRLQGATSPLIMAASGAFAAEVVAADTTGRNMIGQTVLVWKIDNQAHAAYTIGGG